MCAEKTSGSSFVFHPIGIIRTPYKEKFGIPRQSGLIEEAEGRLELLPPVDRAEALRSLEGFSHIWLIWVPHRSLDSEAVLTVRPPRLGGNRKVGVFASRSPVRPNPIGLSLVRLVRVEAESRPPALVLSGIDLLDGTPVLDIKPYLPYADSVPDARGGYAPDAPGEKLAVSFSNEAESALAARPDGDGLRLLISRIIALDPRPAYRGDENADYAFRIADLDVHWTVRGDQAEVERIESIPSS